jgi:hypothetical protein
MEVRCSDISAWRSFKFECEFEFAIEPGGVHGGLGNYVTPYTRHGFSTSRRYTRVENKISLVEA